MTNLKRIKIYFDMDGVLADFSGQRNAVERFSTEKGFFQKLKPIRKSVKAMKFLIAHGYDVNILTASPNQQADFDKKMWVLKHIPEFDLWKMTITRLGENKADYINPKNSLLIDDYTTNLIAFRNSGGKVLKFVNKRDKKIGKHTKLNIKYMKDLRNLYKRGVAL